MSRVPPHDLDAEAACLGAMLQERQAREDATRIVTASDFYDPKLATVFMAIEGLYHQGKAIDPVTVSGAAGLPRSEVASLILAAPLSSNITAYATRVAELGAARRAIVLSEEIGSAGWNGDLDTAVRLLNPERLNVPTGKVDPGCEASVLAAMEHEERWAVKGFLERGDRVMVTGPEGFGKSELLAQMAVMFASGIHPWIWTQVPALRVLVLDLENSVAQSSARYKRLLKIADERYRGLLWVKNRPQGINLRDMRDLGWVDGLCAHHSPDVLVIGPLYKAYRGSDKASKHAEEAAEECAQALDELRVKHDCVLMMEAHAGHGESGDRNGMRPIGSSLWMRWVEFGVGLKPDGDQGAAKLVHWKPSRVRQRGAIWPRKILPGGQWPWTPE